MPGYQSASLGDARLGPSSGPPSYSLGSDGNLPKPRSSFYIFLGAGRPPPLPVIILPSRRKSVLYPSPTFHIVSVHFRKMGLGLFFQVNYLHWESAGM